MHVMCRLEGQGEGEMVLNFQMETETTSSQSIISHHNNHPNSAELANSPLTSKTDLLPIKTGLPPLRHCLQVCLEIPGQDCMSYGS